MVTWMTYLSLVNIFQWRHQSSVAVLVAVLIIVNVGYVWKEFLNKWLKVTETSSLERKGYMKWVYSSDLLALVSFSSMASKVSADMSQHFSSYQNSHVMLSDPNISGF
jgi:hypothetical protein